MIGIEAEFRDMRDFLRDVAVDTIQVAMRRELWIPAVTFSLLADATMLAVNYPFRAGLPPPKEHMITVMTLVILAKCWFSLMLARIALALHRGQVGGVLNHWVPVTDALRIGVITLLLFAPILVGLLMLIAPGLYLLARWSQATIALLDNQATGLDAGQVSSALTAGYRGTIMTLLVAVAVVTIPIEYVVNDVPALAWVWNAVGSTVGAALAASLYVELERRAPWTGTDGGPKVQGSKGS